MGLKDDLMDVFNKHGMKADDADNGGDNTPPAGNGDNAGNGNGDGAGDNGDSGSGQDAGDKASSKVVADLADKIAEKLANAVAKQKGLSQADHQSALKTTRSKIFTNWAGMKEIEYPSDLGSLTKEEKIATFFKALVFHRADPESDKVLRALVEGTDAEGGYLVPEEFRAEVFRVLPDMAIMRRLARIIPMATDTLNLNTLAARPYAYWTAEYASKTTTSAEFGRVTLTPNDLVCLLPVTDQLLADANINVIQLITELFVEAIAAEEDKAFFTGNGSGRPRGINQETLSSVDVLGTLDFDNIINLIDLVPQSVTKSPGSAFVGHRYVKRILRTVKDSNNQYIWRDGGANVGSGQGETRRLPDTLYGYPFFEQNDLDQDELYFGDWRNYIIGDRQAISVRTTTEGGDAWRRNATEIKAVERVDGRAVLTSPFAKLTGITK